jgi:hypothetical protein
MRTLASAPRWTLGRSPFTFDHRFAGHRIAASSTIFGRRAVPPRPNPAGQRWTWVAPPAGLRFGYQVLLALQQATQLEGLAGFRLDANAVSLGDGRGGSVRANATPVTANYFSVLGTRAAAGRLFLGDEDRVPDGAPVVVISHAFWLRRFGGAADAVGTALASTAALHHRRGHRAGFTIAVVGTDMWVPIAVTARHRPGDHGAAHRTRPVWHLERA